MMLGNGSYKPRDSEDGPVRAGKVGVVKEFCSAMGIRGSARHSSGNKGYSVERKVNSY